MTGYEHCVWSFLLDFAGNPPPNTSPTAFFLEAPMRHPALRRSARHSSKRDARPDPAKMIPPEAAAVPADPASPANPQSSHDPAAQNRPAPGVPPDGDHNQGGIRKEGLDYQRDLGSEQDA